ncbi:MAG: cardiolipin synthase [Acetatifactor sp.]|nr:cardiolipin synthase [Acetatifactor sp.]
MMEVFWSNLQTVCGFLVGHLILWNMLFAIIIVFFERKEPRSVWAWLLLLYFIPFLGFLFYLLLGTDMHQRKMFRMKEVEDRLNEEVRGQEYRLQNRHPGEKDEEIDRYTDLIMYNLESSGAVLTDDNDVEIYTDGNAKFDALIEDMRQARKFIHMEYYIIKNDVLFQRIIEVLREKAAEGVEVRILFDSMGCRTVKNRFWKQLNSWGIQTAEFFPALLGRLQLRVNYRNHRKIVVIDNKVGYVGGFNVGREYLGLDKRFGYWRDTHLRISGGAIFGLQLRFILDWNYASGQNLFTAGQYLEETPPGGGKGCKVQIISSGPDNTLKQIRDNYLQLIHGAKHRISIQTPYFIPDESMMSALLIAIRSGVEVRVMIPCKPDHPFVYWATYSYVGELVMAGASCYTYDNGFLHSKGLVVDDEVLCYGTANMDIRSFSLNFEVNAVVYNAGKAREMAALFERDLEHCSQITREAYASRNLKIRLKEQVCRLLSPLL